MRALVTGTTGFVGGYLAPALEAVGHEVIPFDPAADIRDYEAVRGAVAGHEPDLIFHLAAVAWPRETLTDPRRAMDVNVTGALNVLEAVRHTGSHARVVLAGTSEEYGYESRAPGEVLTEESQCRPSTPYGVSKLAATTLAMTYARHHGIHAVVVRPWNHTGWGRQAVNGESAFARKIVAFERGEASCVTHGDLSASRNFTDVRDMARAYVAAAGCGPGIYNACSGRTVTMRQVMDILAGLSEREVVLKQDPRLGRAEHGPFPEPSCAKLTAATGWKAGIPLEETLRWLLDYWRSR